VVQMMNQEEQDSKFMDISWDEANDLAMWPKEAGCTNATSKTKAVS